MKSKINVGRTKNLEFGGVLGSIAMVFGLPIGVYYINLACTKESCSPYVLPHLPSSILELVDLEACLMFFGWFSFQIALHLLPTGQIHLGMPLRDGTKLSYRCNGFTSLVISLFGLFVLVYMGYPISVVYTKFMKIATAGVIFSYILSILLYLKSLTVQNHELAEGANSGVFIYDFFMGHELNPRIGPIDLKFFCELRPGLIGWVILDLCFLAQAHEWYGYIPGALLLIVGFHTLYVADALWHEQAILTTMDIVHDGFGLMLVFGDLVWVPFLYTLQARYALEHPQDWTNVMLLAFFVLNMVGYTIFRGSNSQKNTFRNNPRDARVAHLETMETSAGRKLLVSGWWGMCRHPNYLGDLIMATAWSLPCGFQSIFPYFYPIYFLALLVHRNMRDEMSCQKKYGADWNKYCRRVKYRIFPFIF